jgi:hypothetical protein
MVMRGGLPVIAVRDIAIQKTENSMSFELDTTTPKAVIDFLNGLDPSEVERKAVARFAYDTPTGVAFIEVLKEIANADQ